MRQLLHILLIIALLLGGAEAAVDTVHIDSDHHSSSHIIHDHSNLDADVDHDEDHCNHYCHCVHHIGALSGYPPMSLSGHSTLIGMRDYSYHYKLVSPLYRPPIA